METYVNPNITKAIEACRTIAKVIDKNGVPMTMAQIVEALKGIMSHKEILCRIRSSNSSMWPNRGNFCYEVTNKTWGLTANGLKLARGT